MPRATGSFDVTVTPQPPAAGTPAAEVGMMSLAKTFHGELAATSAGAMLAAHTPSTGAAAYVALERVAGTLGGRTGGFVLAHLGTMTPAAQRLDVLIVPGSGTDGLAGIAGTLAIRIEGAAHHYVLDYELA